MKAPAKLWILRGSDQQTWSLDQQKIGVSQWLVIMGCFRCKWGSVNYSGLWVKNPRTQPQNVCSIVFISPKSEIEIEFVGVFIGVFIHGAKFHRLPMTSARLSHRYPPVSMEVFIRENHLFMVKMVHV